MNIFHYLFPEFFLLTGYLTLFFISFSGTTGYEGLFLRRFITINTIILNLIALVLLFISPKGSIALFHEQIVITPFSQLFKCITILLYTLVLFAIFYQDTYEPRWREILFITQITTLSVLFTVSANNFIALYLIMELTNIGTYGMIALGVNQVKYEAAIKCFFMTAFMSILNLMGMRSLYTYTSTFNVHESALIVQTYTLDESSIPILFALSLLTAYQLFKASSFPYHFWFADALDSSTPFLAGYIAIIPKLAPIYNLCLLAGIFFDVFDHLFSLIIYTAGLLSVILGTFSAAAQTNVNRFFAYSSVAHFGQILIVLSLGTAEAFHMTVTYFSFYSITTISFYAALQGIYQPTENPYIKEIKNLSYFANHFLILKILFTLALLSLSGIPPMIGFFGKAFSLNIFLTTGSYLTLVIIIICNTFAAVNYFKLIVLVWSPSDHQYPFTTTMPFSMKCILIFLIILLIYPPLTFEFFYWLYKIIISF